MRAFQLSVDQLELFYDICGQLKLKTEEEKVALLNIMAQYKQVERVWDTQRTKEKFIEDMAKHFRVMKVTPDEEVKGK